MARELIVFPDLQAAFAPQYFGSVEYYAVMSAFGRVYIDTDMPADKRLKTAHRCSVVDTRDEIMLTVPIVHPHGRHSWNETPISTHGRWTHVHRTALESAYGRTAFFEYYIDRLSQVFDYDYSDHKITVGQLDRTCDSIIRDILKIDNDVVYGSPYEDVHKDYRRIRSFDPAPVSYYQLRADRLGFRWGQSILDLIFNLGPEAPLILRQISNNILFTDNDL